MSAQFTPGPWEAVCNDIEEGRPVGDSGLRFWSVGNYSEQYRGDVCGVHAAEHIGGITIDERNANAHLIAAAPDLYEATDNLLLLMGNADTPITRLARAALAKARGEA